MLYYKNMCANTFLFSYSFFISFYLSAVQTPFLFLYEKVLLRALCYSSRLEIGNSLEYGHSEDIKGWNNLKSIYEMRLIETD